MEPTTSSRRNHEELLRLWFVADGPEPAELEWCGDEDCRLCASVEPRTLEPVEASVLGTAA
jgi:hypothetical protein